MHGETVSSRTGRLPSIKTHLTARAGGGNEVIDALSWGRCAETESGVVTSRNVIHPTMGPNVLRQVILPAERSSTPMALVWSLLSMSPDMSLEMLQSLERSLAKLKGTDKQLFTLLKIVVGSDRVISLALESERTGFPLTSA